MRAPSTTNRETTDGCSGSNDSACTWALAYASLGWAVLPVWWPIAPDACACQYYGSWRSRCKPRDVGKHPIPRKGAHEATTDEATIRRWWTQYPHANIAIALAGAPFFVVDIDPRSGGDVSWQRICGDHDKLPPTVWAHSGSGGSHGLYLRPDGMRLPAKLPGASGVEFPSTYFIVQPARHRFGGQYLWVRSPFEYKIATAPPWLMEMALAAGAAGARASSAEVPGQSSEEARPRAAAAPSSRAGSVGRDTSPSGRDFSRGLRMLRRGADVAAIEEMLRSGESYRSRSHAHGELYVAVTVKKLLAVIGATPDVWAGARRVCVVDAIFEPASPEAASEGKAHRVRLELAAVDGGELLQWPRQYVTLPLSGHERAYPAYDAVMGDIGPNAWLAPGVGTRLAHALVGRELEVVFAPGERLARRMRRAAH